MGINGPIVTIEKGNTTIVGHKPPSQWNFFDLLSFRWMNK
jgi:hypothetical protein